MAYPFHWPYTAFPAPAAAAAAESAATNAAHLASHAPHPSLHPHMHPGVYHYRAYGHPFRRFGMFRRFFWFGSGAAVASWWIHSKQRQQAHREMIEGCATGAGTGGDAHAHSRPWGGWRSEWHDYHHRPMSSMPAAAPVAAPTQASAPLAQVHAAEPIAIDSKHEVAVPPTPTPAEESTQRWGWRARREAQRAAAAAASADTRAAQQSAVAVPRTSTPVVGDNDEMTRIREAVERLYADKMRDVREVQARASEEAKAYARERLDQLSVALDTLRQSLKQQDQATAAAKEKKLV